MANKERKRDDLFIKPKRRAKNFFITSSAKMTNDKNTKTTISSSVFTEMSKSFSDGEHLLDDHMLSSQKPILYMLQEMQQDIDDVYNEVSASSFQASFFPFATIDSGSFGVISSSLVPDKDSKHYLGSSGKEWHTSYMLTASIGGGIFTSASLAAGGGGGTIDTTLKNGSTNAVQNNAVFDGLALKLNLSGGAMTGLIRPIVTAVTGAPKQNLLDASKTNVYEFAAGKAITISSIIPAFTGQEITIMNIGTGAVTLTGTNSAKARSIYHAKNSNYTINQHQAYKLVCSQNQVWYVIS